MGLQISTSVIKTATFIIYVIVNDPTIVHMRTQVVLLGEKGR